MPSDDYGLGKTFPVLCLVYYQAEVNAERNPTAVFQPSLILAPSSLLENARDLKPRLGLEMP